MRSRLVACVLLSSLVVTAFPADRAAAADPWQQWLVGLGKHGFTVTQGGVFEVDNAACTEIVAVFGTCFGNNAAAPYIIPQPPIDDTYVDPFYATDFTVEGATGLPSNMFFRLADTDAVVTLVTLPPKAAYLGYQSYLFTRLTSAYPTPVEDQTVSPDPDRYEIFGSPGNDINDVVLGRQMGKVWNGGTVVYITTSNRTLAETLTKRAAKRGLDTARIFVEPVGEEVTTGTTSAADDLVTLIRYAVPKNADSAQTWMDGLAANVQTFRVSAADDFPVVRYPTPKYTPKQATSEASLEAPMAELARLLRQWLRKREGAGALIEPMISSEHVNQFGEPTGLVGVDCIANGTNCLGDNQDTDAYRFGVVGTLPGSQIAFVAGVNHNRTDNASYISLAIYNMANFSGIASATQTNSKAVGFDSGVLNGSAQKVLKAIGKFDQASEELKAALPQLYVSALSRDCPTSLAANCIDLSDTATLPTGTGVSVTQRAYIKPGTTTGADPDAMLPPLLVFRPSE